MRLTVRDGLATVFVAAAAAVYLLWVTGAAMTGWSVRVAAAVVFGLGWAACVTDQKQMAVVYGAARGGWRPPAAYVVLVSGIGALALVTGVIALAAEQRGHVGGAGGFDGRAVGDRDGQAHADIGEREPFPASRRRPREHAAASANYGVGDPKDTCKDSDRIMNAAWPRDGGTIVSSEKGRWTGRRRRQRARLKR